MASNPRLQQMRMNAQSLSQLSQLTHSPARGVRNTLLVPPLKLAYVRHSGKVGGLELERAYFFKTLCSHFFPNEAHKEWWFPDVFLPHGCLARLHRRNLLRTHYRSDLRSSALSDYTFVLFMRDPCSRAVSSFLWGLPSFGRTARAQSALSLEEFVHNPKLIEHRGRPHPSWHWQSQLEGIVYSNLPRIDLVGCVHSLSVDFNTVIEHLNSRQEVRNGTLMKLPTLLSSESGSKSTGGDRRPTNAARNGTAKGELLRRMHTTSLCPNDVCHGYYSLDCKLSPCWEARYGEDKGMR